LRLGSPDLLAGKGEEVREGEGGRKEWSGGKRVFPPRLSHPSCATDLLKF